VVWYCEVIVQTTSTKCRVRLLEMHFKSTLSRDPEKKPAQPSVRAFYVFPLLNFRGRFYSDFKGCTKMAAQLLRSSTSWSLE
jgi:hypothetical protein